MQHSLQPLRRFEARRRGGATVTGRLRLRVPGRVAALSLCVAICWHVLACHWPTAQAQEIRLCPADEGEVTGPRQLRVVDVLTLPSAVTDLGYSVRAAAFHPTAGLLAAFDMKKMYGLSSCALVGASRWHLGNSSSVAIVLPQPEGDPSDIPVPGLPLARIGCYGGILSDIVAVDSGFTLLYGSALVSIAAADVVADIERGQPTLISHVYRNESVSFYGGVWLPERRQLIVRLRAGVAGAPSVLAFSRIDSAGMQWSPPCCHCTVSNR